MANICRVLKQRPRRPYREARLFVEEMLVSLDPCQAVIIRLFFKPI